MILLGRIFMERFAQNVEEKENQTEKKINDDGRKKTNWSVGQRVEAE